MRWNATHTANAGLGRLKVREQKTPGGTEKKNHPRSMTRAAVPATERLLRRRKRACVAGGHRGMARVLRRQVVARQVCRAAIAPGKPLHILKRHDVGVQRIEGRDGRRLRRFQPATDHGALAALGRTQCALTVATRSAFAGTTPRPELATCNPQAGSISPSSPKRPTFDIRRTATPTPPGRRESLARKAGDETYPISGPDLP